MAIHLKDVVLGDQLIITNKLGLALAIGRRKGGELFRFVPNRTQKAAAEDIEKYFGLVRVNDADNQLLTLHITPILSTWDTHQYDTRKGLPGIVHYSALRVVVRLSTIHLDPHTEVSVRRTGFGPRPTSRAIGTEFKPYRTLERVIIPC